MSIERKIKRKREAKERKMQKDITSKLNMFDRLPEECLACEKVFDNQNKEMVSTWNVVVREVEGVVRLYCPDCWGTAQEVIKTYWAEKEDKE
jgi:hypothetical protein